MKRTPAEYDLFEDSTSVYVLRLYITGASPNSARAVENLKSICEDYLTGRHELEIIDIYQEPMIAQRDQVIALPMLVKSFPLPVKRLIGDMSDTNKVLRSLGLNNDN